MGRKGGRCLARVTASLGGRQDQAVCSGATGDGTDVELGSEVGMQGPHRGDAVVGGRGPGQAAPRTKRTHAPGGTDRRWNDRREDAETRRRRVHARALGKRGLTFWRDPIFVRASGQTAVMWIKPGYVARSIAPRGGALALFLFCSRGI